MCTQEKHFSNLHIISICANVDKIAFMTYKRQRQNSSLRCCCLLIRCRHSIFVLEWRKCICLNSLLCVLWQESCHMCLTSDFETELKKYVHILIIDFVYQIEIGKVVTLKAKVYKKDKPNHL